MSQHHHNNTRPNLLENIPLEVWQSCIFEYWLGPIHEINQCLDKLNIDEIEKFKNVIYSKIIDGLDLMSVRSVHKLCYLVSRRFRELFIKEMDEFWLKVSNMLEMAVYWRRYETSKGATLAQGDITAIDSIPYVQMQKLIEATEMNLNREYTDIIDPSMCREHWHNSNIKKKNDVNTELMHQEFVKRFEKLIISQEKYEKIRKVTQLDSYDLFLHKSFIISLDMISYFDSERSNSGYSSFSTETQCQLFNKGLFSLKPNPNSLGLIISHAENSEEVLNIDSKFIAISISNSEWAEKQFTNIPNTVQYLCLEFNHHSYSGYKSLIDKRLFDENDPVFPNVRDLTIRIGYPEDDDYFLHNLVIEKNILSGITRTRFPKLIRISICGFGSMESLLDCEILSQLPYVEIIQFSHGYDYELTRHWSERKVHELVTRHQDSLIHHLVVHACISRINNDADYGSIKEYYNLSKPKFVASISHSSFNEYYENCFE
ncbi:predicted protein [Naegleria gruberi]|uniref:Predicted protein n=1 Tax=Naegleria gruberi TaxID=5762 RepID=D2V3K1_NAEGR|nr:uncharacterized protein NAEGRDRAFT_63392 [Naegleria gruberi]EFC48652.1 predicted protein [Naegleria gruberi]|eukprot:XP_002681396.1 predicted protein [Naegleria gruberi strain NEG-M]